MHICLECDFTVVSKSVYSERKVNDMSELWLDDGMCFFFTEPELTSGTLCFAHHLFVSEHQSLIGIVNHV